ncbi:MAG: ParB/Srx family N-terminal domain-containing protein [Muribaculaceae bacterium]|nr:ParB/Srx family N-terminal domain-containing protein [Muribaculaceae bacterium]
MQVVTKNLSDLHEPDINVRIHPTKQIREYVRSLKMFGQVKPIIVDESGMIIAGNGLYAALVQMGATTAECCVMTGLTEGQKKKLMLADNRVYELGASNMEVLEDIVRSLEGDVDIPGWDEELLSLISASTSEIDDAISSYGSFSPESVEIIQSRETQPITSENYERGHYDDVQAAPAMGTIPPPVNVPLTTPAPAEQVQETPSESHTAVTSEKTVICPHCGQKIFLV